MCLYLLGQAADCWSQEQESEKKRLSLEVWYFQLIVKMCSHCVWEETPSLSYLSDFAKARGVNRSVFRDGHCVPAVILGRGTTPWGVGSPTAWRMRASTTWRVRAPTASTHPASWASTGFLLRDEGLLHLHLLPVFLQLSIFVDLVDGLGTLIASPGHPVILEQVQDRIVRMIGGNNNKHTHTHKKTRMTLKMYSFSVHVTIVWMNTKQSLCTLVILMSVSKSVLFITTVFTEQDSEREWDNHSSRVSVFVLKGNKTCSMCFN